MRRFIAAFLRRLQPSHDWPFSGQLVFSQSWRILGFMFRWGCRAGFDGQKGMVHAKPFRLACHPWGVAGGREEIPE
ncbi:hypothetical protein THTE_3321 [Thermogutta terrifontis]|uniref:Uncharacterized protein n=1 Tax=Thermogutta terrifontis TaxID=1331910 RepID=A0A286RIY8_9BACT|nr:hypothetical protein THTE_3321 [Thermogutta terrifontis]